MKSGKKIFLANHRSQADFFIHNIILEGTINILSRMMVAVIFPGFLFAYKTLWLFNRSGNINPERLN